MQCRVWGEHVVCWWQHRCYVHFDHIKGQIFFLFLNCNPALLPTSALSIMNMNPAIHHNECKWKQPVPFTNGFRFGCGVQNPTPLLSPTKCIWHGTHLLDIHITGHGSDAIRDFRTLSPAQATQLTSEEGQWRWQWWWWRRRLKWKTHKFWKGCHEARLQVWLHDEPVPSMIGIRFTKGHWWVQPKIQIWFTLTRRQLLRTNGMATRRVGGFLQREPENVHPSSKRSRLFTDRP